MRAPAAWSSAMNMGSTTPTSSAVRPGLMLSFSTRDLWSYDLCPDRSIAMNRARVYPERSHQKVSPPERLTSHDESNHARIREPERRQPGIHEPKNGCNHGRFRRHR